MQEALRAKLLAVPAFAKLCPTVAWDERPQSAPYPVTVLTLVAPGRGYNHDGWDGLNETLVQADIWALSNADALTISRVLTAVIEPTTTISGWEIGPAFLEDEDGGGTEDLGGGRKVYRRRMDWIIMNRPSA